MKTGVDLNKSILDLIEAEITANLISDLEGRRVFHGRGGCFPGCEPLNIDFFPPVAIIQLFEPLAEVESLFDLVRRLLPCETVLLQERFKRDQSWTLMWGGPVDEMVVVENGLRYQLQLMRNQNTGFFPDMRLGRELTSELAQNRKVLNLFAYTCSFSVAAMKAGAESVYNLDVAKSALRTGKRNHLLNKIDDRDVHYLGYDVLKSFGTMKKKGPFGLIIIDPPTHQKGRFSVEKDYARIIKRLPDLLEQGGDVLACLNTPYLKSDFLKDQFDPRFQRINHLGRPPEFKEKDPEESLKILHYRFKG